MTKSIVKTTGFTWAAFCFAVLMTVVSRERLLQQIPNNLHFSIHTVAFVRTFAHKCLKFIQLTSDVKFR